MADSGRDLILAPNEYCYVISETTGNVTLYVGPSKTALGQQDQVAIFNINSKKFEHCEMEKAVQLFISAPEGWYISLKNPSQDNATPRVGAANNMVALNIGFKVNITGPLSFPLWPGQIAKVIKGHYIKSNQYLLARVYNETAALANWGNRILKHRNPDSVGGQLEFKEGVILKTGNIFTVTGNLFSYFIPPTGIDIIPNDKGDYCREAITLERLEYCILRDENGEKRFVSGPAIVFPRPTEEFVNRDGLTKFRAVELTPYSGLHIKVLVNYTEDGSEYKLGEELFITGTNHPIYFPRQEHAIIKYGNKDVHYAIIIPEGEARYVLNKETGNVDLIRGPNMFLPDPRKQIIVRRVLNKQTIDLLYPGNIEACIVNKAFDDRVSSSSIKASSTPKKLSGGPGNRGIPNCSFNIASSDLNAKDADATYSLCNVSSALSPYGVTADSFSYNEISDFAGDGFSRETISTEPSAVTLSNKYNGAVTVSIWPGYAIQTIRKNGASRTIIGPSTIMLEYDEEVRTLALSTGTPKDAVRAKKIAYLRLKDNRISDQIFAETSDGVKVKLIVDYWIDFIKNKEGDEHTWFLKENYVQAICNKMQVIVKNICQRFDSQEFCESIKSILPEEIVEKVNVLPEISVKLTQIDVIQATIEDPEIAKYMLTTKTDVIKKRFEANISQLKYDVMLQLASIERGMEKVREETAESLHGIAVAGIERNRKELEHRQAAQRAEKEAQMQTELSTEEWKCAIQEKVMAYEQFKIKLNLEYREADLALRLRELVQQTEAWAQRMSSASPQLVAAINELSRNDTLGKMVTSMAPMALLGGKSVVDVVKSLLDGTVFDKSSLLLEKEESKE